MTGSKAPGRAAALPGAAAGRGPEVGGVFTGDLRRTEASIFA